MNQKFKVKKIGIFGSYALDQAAEDSDVDLLVEFYEPIGWEFIDLQAYLEEILGKKVDLVTVKALKPQLKETILSQVITYEPEKSKNLPARYYAIGRQDRSFH